MNRKPTEKQKPIIEEKWGRFVVRACPGSGKTYTVAARLAHLLKKWDKTHAGIAVLSFTNVAWQEIGQYLTQDFDIPAIHYPHFLGTIDSFLNTYLFLPFGHTVMNCEGRPTLSGPPYDNIEPTETWLPWERGECNKNQCRLNAISYDVKGKLTSFDKRSHFKNCTINHERCQAMKLIFNRSGYATQLDANFFSMRLLQKYPFLAEALATRFPCIIVDEAQDSSAIQMKIIDLLAEAGLKEIMLVGDPDQAIFEWRTAEPSNFIAKYDEWKENSVELDNNWRSTRSICTFASTLSVLKMEPANEELPDPGPEPRIVPYGSDDFEALVHAFKQECEETDCDPTKSAILCRSRGFIHKITSVGQAKDWGKPSPWRKEAPLTRDLVFAAYARDSGEWLYGFRIVEKALAKLQTGKNRVTIDDIRELHRNLGFSAWRTRVLQVLQLLPDTLRTPLGQWVDEARSKLQAVGVAEQLIQIKAIGKNKEYYRTLSIADLVGGLGTALTTDGLVCDTVHAFKGKTLDAVLFVVGKQGGSHPYKNVLKDSLEENEELRIIYVAITRARKLLWIAVPEEDRALWCEKFEGGC